MVVAHALGCVRRCAHVVLVVPHRIAGISDSETKDVSGGDWEEGMYPTAIQQ